MPNPYNIGAITGPAYQQYSGTRRTYRRRRYNGGYKIPASVSTALIARKALRLASYTKSQLNSEYKFLDDNIDDVTVTSTPTFRLLSSIPCGTDVNSRTGNGVRLKSSYLQAWPRFFPGTAAGNIAVLRITIFIDLSPDGLTPLSGELFTNPGARLTALYNPNFMGTRFRLVTSLSIPFDYEAVATQWIKEYRKLNQVAKWAGTTGAVSDTSTGQLFICFWCNVIGGGSPELKLTYSHRVTYVDN